MRRLARMFRALADETRLRILGLIQAHGHLCVCEVEALLGITQSKASRHLRYLRDAGLLEDRRDGVVVNYTLPEQPDPAAASVLALLPDLVPEERVPGAEGLLVQLRDARGSRKVTIP